VRITRVADFGFEFPDSGLTLQFEVCGFGIRSGDRRIVIDPWMAFDSKRREPDAASRWEHVEGQLAAADLTPDDVDTVVFTHLDGVGWAVGPDSATPSFPNARHLVPTGELAAFDAGLRHDTDALSVLRAGGLVDAVDPPYDVARGVTLEPAAGHTAYSAFVRVVDESGQAFFVGHMFLHPAQVHRYDRAENEENPPVAIKTRLRLLDDAAARGAVLYGDLWDSPGCGTVTKHGDDYELAFADA
jgi:hypothetical protein